MAIAAGTKTTKNAISQVNIFKFIVYLNVHCSTRLIGFDKHHSYTIPYIFEIYILPCDIAGLHEMNTKGIITIIISKFVYSMAVILYVYIDETSFHSERV